jgi:uncharacterized protein YceH (UPF0502 family)
MTTPVLEPTEARILGVLVEKALTTPDQYPLSLNAATNGANQRSNRDPVLDLLEGDVYAALQSLMRKGLVGASHPAGGRVEKFRHNGEALLGVDTPQLAVLAELWMRGPQMPGELRARASRMTPIESLPALMAILAPLTERGLVRRLPAQPGARAERYAQTLSPDAHPIDAAPPSAARMAPHTPAVPDAPRARAGGTTPPEAAVPAAGRAPAAPAAPAEDAKLAARVAELEGEVGRIKRQLRHLAWKLGEKLEG